MDTLSLAPFPCERSEEATGFRRVRNEGFVDESVILAHLAKGVYDRAYVQREDMVLSSSEDDYAGWALPVASPFRAMVDLPPPISLEARLPAAPTFGSSVKFLESGLSEPHQGAHRWWLFGLSGALTCGFLSLTLLSLAQRTVLPDAMAGEMPSVRVTEPIVKSTFGQESQPALVKVAAKD